jgi:cell division cycle 14
MSWAALVEDSLYYWVRNGDTDGDGQDAELPADGEGNVFVSITAFAASYAPYHRDFGPVNLAVTKRCVDFLDQATESEERVVVCLSDADAQCLTNSITLLALYMMVRYGSDPDTAWSYFAPAMGQTVPFHDASYYEDTFCLGVRDVLRGYRLAQERGWIDMDAFDADEFEWLEHLDNGDFTWLIPGQLLCLSSPGSPHTGLDAAQTANALARLGVNTLVQLNDDQPYDPSPFRRAGIDHVPLVFPDGDVPPLDVIDEYLALMSRPGTTAAIHCKAGLGRTGTLACMWMVAEHGLGARAAVGWARLCRPGSVIGPQQQFLTDFERTVRAGTSSPSASPRRDAPPLPSPAMLPVPMFTPPAPVATAAAEELRSDSWTNRLVTLRQPAPMTATNGAPTTPARVVPFHAGPRRVQPAPVETRLHIIPSRLLSRYEPQHSPTAPSSTRQQHGRPQHPQRPALPLSCIDSRAFASSDITRISGQVLVMDRPPLSAPGYVDASPASAAYTRIEASSTPAKGSRSALPGYYRRL